MALAHPEKPPVSRGNFLFGSALAFVKDPISAFMSGWRECGEIVCFRFIGPLPFKIAGAIASRITRPIEIYLAVHPSFVKHVLQDYSHNYLKDPSHSAQLKALAGEGLTMSEGETWRTHRRIMQPAFRRQHTAEFVKHTVAATQIMLDRWESQFIQGRPLDLYSEMLQLAFKIVARTMFNLDLAQEAQAVVRDSATVLEHAYRGMRTPFPLPEWLPLPSIRQFVAARRNLVRMADRLVSERKQARVQNGEDLLSLLVSRCQSEKSACDEVITTILAGHDTTGLALTWSFYLLSKHIEVASKLRSSVNATLNGRLPTPDDLPNLCYAESVVKEAMRLFPPAWILSRQTVKADELGGYAIPAGATVFVSPYVTHRHPAFWDNPEEFNPDRFSHSREAPVQFAYFPFGGGPRLCIGYGLALTSAQIVLSMISQRYHLSLVPGQSITAVTKLTLHPSRSVWMNVRKHARSA